MMSNFFVWNEKVLHIVFFCRLLNPFQPSVTFHIETSHLICSANLMTGFYMKCNTELKMGEKGMFL